MNSLIDVAQFLQVCHVWRIITENSFCKPEGLSMYSRTDVAQSKLKWKPQPCPYDNLRQIN